MAAGGNDRWSRGASHMDPLRWQAKSIGMPRISPPGTGVTRWTVHVAAPGHIGPDVFGGLPIVPIMFLGAVPAGQS